MPDYAASSWVGKESNHSTLIVEWNALLRFEPIERVPLLVRHLHHALIFQLAHSAADICGV